MSLDKLKLITNYKEDDLSKSPTYSAMYIDYIDDLDQEYLRELKTKRRNVVIDVLLEEREESELDNIYKHHEKWNGNSRKVDLFKTEIYQVSSKVQNIESYDDIYNDLLSYIDKETNSEKIVNTVKHNLDLVLKNDKNLTTYENIESNCRKILTRLTMCSNIIDMEGRIGSGNFILVGESNWDYFHHIQEKNNNLLSMSVIYTDKIESDKIIVGRKNNQDQGGISHIMDLENKKYVKFETNFWKKQYCWFKIL
jgi:hypothetical protein